MRTISSFFVLLVVLLSVFTIPIGGALSAHQQPDPLGVYE
jgi:hypothetical protein